MKDPLTDDEAVREDDTEADRIMLEEADSDSDRDADERIVVVAVSVFVGVVDAVDVGD